MNDSFNKDKINNYVIYFLNFGLNPIDFYDTFKFCLVEKFEDSNFFISYYQHLLIISLYRIYLYNQSKIG